ncbi:porphobilinogen synthase [Thermoplasmatales archaeon BRNA1]|nr:porphobilinogen synthase [Thermoplasmatales archaeon BRNA1]
MNMFPINRGRRLRQTPAIRGLVRETRLDASDLILPLFFDANISEIKYTDSMPDVPTYPLSGYADIVKDVMDSGVSSVLVFGVPARKDGEGSDAYSDDGVVQVAIRGLKAALKDPQDLIVISDLCMCEYTDHGHCGILREDGDVDNDATIEYYGRIAVSQAKAGADMIAPSGMMDGQIDAIRSVLDAAGFQDVPIMAYSAKYQSAFYGPFRDIANSAPTCSCHAKKDRATYQMDPANRREALREIAEDLDEGADIIMVKPAGPYLDIVREAADTFPVPICAYQVSGEYAMTKAAAKNGWIDEERIMMESLLGIKRAGADMIITYYAKVAARMLR